MVMATPSPQQVGREFVRQYYTVLHEAPDVLHRFYSSGSTFVHGGVDRPDRPFEEPVVGQLEIDKKIKNLNFKDCHTKIRQVDSQLTIGSGVVVQVTGELSNNGEPMRRFMQTFVLAPQTPKKFYVHNDIFRYQDEVYQDNSDTESEDQHINEASLITKTAVLNMNNYYEQNHQQEEATGQQSTSSMSSSLPILTSPNHADQQQQQQIMEQADLTIQSSVKEQNGHMNGHMNVNTSMEETTVNQVAVETAPAVAAVEIAAPVVLESELPVENVNSVQKEEVQAQNTETKINSWAKLVQSSGASVLENTGMLTGGNSQVYQTNQYLPSAPKFGNKEQTNVNNNNQNAGKQAKTNGGPKANHNHNKSRNQDGARGGNQQQNQQNQQDKGQQQQQQQQQPREPREPKEPKEPRGTGEEDEKKFGRYPDGQQVFVGNLNQDLSEAELRTYFSQYGKVMDMRINTNSKQQSGRRLPNYGFVVFEEKQAVENLLSASKANSITYKNDKGVEYRLNVEEKRARQGRISSGLNKQSQNNRNTRSSSNGSRNGGQQQNGERERQERPKKNYSSNTQETQGGGYERREGGFNNNNRKSDVHTDGQMVDNGPRRNNASNPRRS